MEDSWKLKSDNIRHKIGFGSISLIMFILGLLFSFSFGKYGALGDTILHFIGLNPWSNGDTGLHYTLSYSLVFFIPALIIGYKFTDDFGAKIGKKLSLFAVIFLSVLSIFFIL